MVEAAVLECELDHTVGPARIIFFTANVADNRSECLLRDNCVIHVHPASPLNLETGHPVACTPGADLTVSKVISRTDSSFS